MDSAVLVDRTMASALFVKGLKVTKKTRMRKRTTTMRTKKKEETGIRN